MASAPEAKTKWLGGYVDYSSGKPVYYIRKQVRGRRYHVSTRCHTERGALVELDRFEKDPANYSPLGTPGPNALFLDKDLARGNITRVR